MSEAKVLAAPAVRTQKKSAGAFYGCLDAAAEDSGDWIDHGEYDAVYEAALSCFMNFHIDLEFDPTMARDKALQQSQVGYRLFKVGTLWEVGINWKRTWQQKIPPHHMGIAYKDQPVGILSPNQTVRTCWSCGAYGWYVVPFAERLAKGLDRIPERLPLCMPRVPCPGVITAADGNVVGQKKCGAMDWWGDHPRLRLGVSRDDFQEACAAELAGRGNEDELYEEMTVGYGLDGTAYRLPQAGGGE